MYTANPDNIPAANIISHKVREHKGLTMEAIEYVVYVIHMDHEDPEVCNIANKFFDLDEAKSDAREIRAMSARLQPEFRIRLAREIEIELRTRATDPNPYREEDFQEKMAAGVYDDVMSEFFGPYRNR